MRDAETTGSFGGPGVLLMCGVMAGLVGGLLGIGGGIVLIPMLTAWAGFDQHSAHGTGIVAVAITALVGVVVYGRGEAIDVAAALQITIVALPATIVAARFSPRVSAARLRRIFGLFVIVVALILPFRDVLGGGDFLLGGGMPVMLVLGAASGVISGLLGVGGGSVLVPGLVLITGFPQQLAQGTSLAVILPSSGAGALAHARIGQVRGRLLPPILVGTFAGAWAGGAAALALPGQTLRIIFSVVLLFMGVRFVLRERSAR
ncbi:MAG: sulfite exporter TauE/SafE family protein [Gemmatimonadota bacterium]|nr:sulfite exporter TauE/SafE family protein [Gemmatimonadota bacterium]